MSKPEYIDATRWHPSRIRQWRRDNPSLDPDKHLTLGDPHMTWGGKRWDAAFGPLPATGGN